MSLNWDKLTPTMRRALRDPRNRQPLRFGDTGEVMFDADERQHIDRKQARVLRMLLTDIPSRGTISGSYDLKAIDTDEEG